MFDYQTIINSYLAWIKDNTSIKLVKNNNIFEITTPFLDRHNDHLQIFVKKRDNSFLLTDDGETLNDLRASGIDLDTPNRQKLMYTMLNGFGVQLGDQNDLNITADENNIGQKKHNLIQAILSVNDLYTTSKETVISLFKEDVENFFLARNIIYSKDIKLTGKSGFDHNIDFLISASRKQPERLIKTINNAKKDAVLTTIMAFNDILLARRKDTRNIIIYNDAEFPISSDVSNAMKSYQVMDIPWTKREGFVPELLIN